jgi:hypothetical protein
MNRIARRRRHRSRTAALLGALAAMVLAVLPHLTLAQVTLAQVALAHMTLLAPGHVPAAAAAAANDRAEPSCHGDRGGGTHMASALPCCQGGCALLAPAAAPRLALPLRIAAARADRRPAAARDTVVEPPERPPRPARS